MFRIYFFHAIFEVWDGPTMLSKRSDYQTVLLNENESATDSLEEWVDVCVKHIDKSQKLSSGTTYKNIVVTHASFIPGQIAMKKEDLPEGFQE